MVAGMKARLNPRQEITYVDLQGPTGWTMTGDPAMQVNLASATYGRPWGEREAHHMQGLNKSHSELVKFYDRDLTYYIVLDILRDFTLGAKRAIPTRFGVVAGHGSTQDQTDRLEPSSVCTHQGPRAV